MLTGLFLILLSCKKDNDRLIEKVPAFELLNQKPWTLVSHGLDRNKNDKIEPSEEAREECQIHNITNFYPDGTGLFDDNGISCGIGIEKDGFSWALTNTETGIDFRYDSLRILTDHELTGCKELFISNNDTVKFILRYSH